MLLAGPPKTGKSYLASELALALSLPFSAEEKERTLWCAGVPKPATEAEHPISRRFIINPKQESRDKLPGARGWNVLVFTLEMNVSAVPQATRRPWRSATLIRALAPALNSRKSFSKPSLKITPRSGMSDSTSSGA